MISISTLRTSQLEALSSSLANGERVSEFTEATARFLANTPVDGGADSDLIATIGYRIANADIWSHIKPETLASAWKSAPVSAVRLFLGDAPQEYLKQVLHRLNARQRPKPRPGYAVKLDEHVIYTLREKGLGVIGVNSRRAAAEAAHVALMGVGLDPKLSGVKKKPRIVKGRGQRVLEVQAAKMAKILSANRDDDENKPAKSGRRQHHR